VIKEFQGRLKMRAVGSFGFLDDVFVEPYQNIYVTNVKQHQDKEDEFYASSKLRTRLFN
jgi:hypothetical protein